MESLFTHFKFCILFPYFHIVSRAFRKWERPKSGLLEFINAKPIAKSKISSVHAFRLFRTNKWQLNSSVRARYTLHSHTQSASGLDDLEQPWDLFSSQLNRFIAEKTMWLSPRTNLFTDSRACFPCMLCPAELLIYWSIRHFLFHYTYVDVKSIKFKCRPFKSTSFVQRFFSKQYNQMMNQGLTGECVNLFKVLWPHCRWSNHRWYGETVTNSTWR